MVESSKAKTGSNLFNNKNNSSKVKEAWDYNRSYNYGKESTLGSKFSWPPRPYTCSFCKREFRSAQALGGHMNVHRRDRARLNQSIPWDINLQQHANLISPNNPYFHNSSSSTTTTFADHQFSPAYPPTIGYPLPSSTTPPSITACSSSAPQPSPTDEYIPRSSSFSQSLSTKRQENVKKSTRTTLPMMDMFLEVGDQHQQLKGIMNENYHYHQQQGGDIDMNIHGQEIVRLDLEIGLCSEDDLDLELRLGFS